MASNTGKKGKKSKEKKLSLQDFLATSATASSGGTTQVAVQKVSSWAEECEDDEDHKKIEFISLPTAPRAARILDDTSIPQDPPFLARVANLPFDINEGDLDEFFLDNNIHVREMKLARDDANDRLRGFGVIEFDTRDDLMEAIMLTDPTIRGRRIRLEVTTESDSFAGRTVRKRYDNYNNFGSRDGGEVNTNWRDKKESTFETVDGGRERGGDRDRGERRNYQSRSTFQNRHENQNSNNGGDDTNWRLGERPVSDSPPPERRRFGNNDRRGGDRNENRGDRGDRGDRGGRYGDRREPREQTQEERPKLNIAPRTLPLPELNFPKEEELERGTRKISLNGGDKENHDDSGLPDEANPEEKSEAPKPKPVPKEDIFGQAKPVDTTAREKEIEEKMERGKEQREKERDAPPSTQQQQQQPEKKDVIMIQTESSRRRDDETNWRKRDEPPTNGASTDNKTRHMGGRQIGRNDPRPFNKDNRDNRNYNNRGMRGDRDRRDGDRDRRDGDRDRRDGDRDRRDSGRTYGRDAPRRDQFNAGSEIRRDDMRDRELRENREPMKRDLPKFAENTGPNLHVSNAFAGLDVEDDAE